MITPGADRDTTKAATHTTATANPLTNLNSIAYARDNGTREVEQVASMLANNPEIAETIITHRYRSRKPPKHSGMHDAHALSPDPVRVVTRMPPATLSRLS